MICREPSVTASYRRLSAPLIIFRDDPWQASSWTITPTATLGAELVLGNPRVASTGSLYGCTVNQYAAYDRNYLLEGGLGLAAQHGAFGVKAGVNALHGDAGTGVNGLLSAAYRF